MGMGMGMVWVRSCGAIGGSLAAAAALRLFLIHPYRDMIML